MIRHMTVVAALTVSAGAASAAFIGIDIREDKNPPSATGAAGFPGSDNVRLFNLYAMFDAPGGMASTNPNAVLNVGQLTPTPASPFDEGFGINLDTNPNASFYRTPPAVAGTPTVGGVNVDLASDVRARWNTYVSIGVKEWGDSYYNPGIIFEGDNSAADADFGLHTRGTPLEDRPPLQRQNWISGGWFNSTPPSFQGRALDLGDGTFGTFLAQLAVMFPGDGDVGEFGGLSGNPDPQINSMGTWYGDIFEGTLLIFTQDPGGGALRHDITFMIPTPGALALFSLAGVAGLRRRR
jgi:MYXO-CTERM domain-containing protein